jgi:16S rRNA (cytosine967-C5)-methyltransferase
LLVVVAQQVAAVRRGESLSATLPAVDTAMRPAVQALTFHVMRRLGAAQAARALLAPKAPPPEVDALLVTALALAWPGAAPPPYAVHTLVDQAVAAMRRQRPAAAGFVNAVLRRFTRETEAIAAQAVAASPQARFNHPTWWIERVRRDWPQPAPAVLDAADAHPPMTLRVNPRRTTVDAARARLAAAGLPTHAAPHPGAPHALTLLGAAPVHALPGFAQGELSVQDAAAQRAAPLLVAGGAIGAPLRAGARVLDACAAPGGKTAQLLELADLDLLAIDHDAARLPRVHHTLDRLGLRAEVRAADAVEPAAWWDGRPFDAVLLDAPCTASGIVRRHPDVRWLRRPGDVARLAARQRALLAALWPLVAPGGRLLYATCSVFRAEGQDVIDAFLQREAGAGAVADPASPGHLLPLPENPADPASPGAPAGDGFFLSLLHKPRLA